LGLAGAAAIVGAGVALEPVWLRLFGETRDLARFDGTATLSGLLGFLALSWTFAALGEEIAFRGVLMRGLSSALGNGAGTTALALLLQAGVFGLVHTYQGPAGIAATTVSGLIFGVVVLVARGSLWPAMLAHGFANTYGLVSLYLANS
jgi:membrane protease YdiL (CAAX protease family)